MIYELILSLHLALTQPKVLGTSSALLASHSINLENRYDNQFVNDVFRDNILLTLYYLDNQVNDKSQIDWERITNQPLKIGFTLKPTETFAFHEHTLPNYSDNLVKTTNANFIGSEGFRNSGHLIGDGVCHLASLMYWVAEEAGLETYNPSDHNFAKINEIPKEYGSGILSPNPLGNLYIVNNLEKPTTFSFDFDGKNLTVTVVTQ
jgi:VanW like protein